MKEKIMEYVRNKQKLFWEKTFNTNFKYTKPISINNNKRNEDNAQNYKNSKITI
jgi:hypothetical protein